MFNMGTKNTLNKMIQCYYLGGFLLATDYVIHWQHGQNRFVVLFVELLLEIDHHWDRQTWSENQF